MPQAIKSKPSEKNTKQEILAAYHELLAESGEKPATVLENDPSLVNVDELGNAAIKQLGDLRRAMNLQLDRIGAELMRGTETVRDVQLAAVKERARLTERHAEQQRGLDTEIIAVRKRFEREQTLTLDAAKEADRQRELERARDEEAYRYGQSMNQRNDRDAFEREKAERERTLAEQESYLKDHQQAIKTMEQELETVPKRIEVAVKAAETAVTARLTLEHERALHDSDLSTTHATSLHQVAVTTLETTNKRQAEELDQLKRQLVAANQQLKEIAVAVIEGRTAASTSTTTGHAS